MKLRQTLLSLVATMAILVIAGCSVREGTPEPSATPDDLFIIVTATPGSPADADVTPTRVTSYVVREGDSLIDIAAEFDITLEALLAANDIEDPDSIFAGQRLTIPAVDS